MENHQYELLRGEIKGLRELLTEQIRGIREDYKRIEDANEEMRDSLKEQSNSLKDQFVTQADFKPVRSIVYGMVAIMLMALLTVILKNAMGK